MHCPLCGHEFDETQMICHTSCVFHKRCAIICCPNCGYQVPDERKSHLAEFFRKRFARSTEPPADSPVRPLTTLRPGQQAQVVEVGAGDPHRQERLSVFGVIPGAQVTLQQRHPAYVVRIGFTELSLEHDIADGILVEVMG